MLPYGRQTISEDDIRAVCDALRSDWLTTGPAVDRFEHGVCEFTGAKHAVAASSGTAALHLVLAALGVGPGDEVIVPALTFVATANAALYCGATPVFADVDFGSLLLDPAAVEARITPRTKAVIAVDYAGQPCDYDRLSAIASRHGIALVADACHSLGASYRGRKVGTLAAATVLSFHPVKHITTGEGGMVLTGDAAVAERARMLRNHGVTTDHRQRSRMGTWSYDMVELGQNYRLSDIACALGASQLGHLPGWLERRRALAAAYDAAFVGCSSIEPLERCADVEHAFHLYVVRLTPAGLRSGAFRTLREAGIGANVHYRPVYDHSYYRRRLGNLHGSCPRAEAAYEAILSLPMFPLMTASDVDLVASRLKQFAEGASPSASVA
jgi:UDP-4-amino-4,6-dideoxy-N-acetyl-beta-L-altrosamine transaminase